jgi:hypothetical protein
MPFTTSPMYFGIITILLAFIGIYYNFKKNALVQAMVVFIYALLSFGRTWPLLYDTLFYLHTFCFRACNDSYSHQCCICNLAAFAKIIIEITKMR